MKTLTEYLSNDTFATKGDLNEAAGKVIDMAAAEKQMISLVDSLNRKTIGLVQKQMEQTKKYLESANKNHVRTAVEQWMKKYGVGYAHEIQSGSNEWWDLYNFIMKKVYKYETPIHFAVIEPDEQWEDAMGDEYMAFVKKIASL